MVTRTRNTSKSNAQDAKIVEPKLSDAYARYQQAAEELMAEGNVPTHNRVLVALVSGCVVGAGLGAASMTLVNTVVAGALVLTGSAFLSLLIYVVGLALAIYAGLVAGQNVMNYVLTKRADEHVNVIANKARGAVSYVRGYFKRDEPSHA